MSQRDRVLRALKRHPEGITQVDFLAPNVIDGGHPITRLAARIRDLREDGQEIEVAGEKYGCALYRLPQPERVPVQTGPAPSTEDLRDTDSLFVLPPQNAILGDEAA